MDREKRTATWSVPASSTQETPVLLAEPCRPISPCWTSPRGCSAFLPRALPSRKNAPPRAQPAHVANLSLRFPRGFVTSQLLRGAGTCGYGVQVDIGVWRSGGLAALGPAMGHLCQFSLCRPGLANREPAMTRPLGHRRFGLRKAVWVR